MKKTKSDAFTEASALSFFAAHLDKLGWSYRHSEDGRTLSSGFNGPGLLWDFAVSAHAGGDGGFLLLVNSYIPTKALPERRAACSELLTRINYELAVGCFEMDLAEGTINFRTSVSLPGADITPGIVAELLHSNLAQVRERYRQIAAVLYGGTTPEQALKPKAESPVPRFELN